MKIRLLAVATGLSLLMAACIKDKNPDKSDGNLIGTWNVNQVKGLIIENGVPKGSEIIDDNPKGFVRFDKDGKGGTELFVYIIGSCIPQHRPFSMDGQREGNPNQANR